VSGQYGMEGGKGGGVHLELTILVEARLARVRQLPVVFALAADAVQCELHDRVEDHVLAHLAAGGPLLFRFVTLPWLARQGDAWGEGEGASDLVAREQHLLFARRILPLKAVGPIGTATRGRRDLALREEGAGFPLDAPAPARVRLVLPVAVGRLGAEVGDGWRRAAHERVVDKGAGHVDHHLRSKAEQVAFNGDGPHPGRSKRGNTVPGSAQRAHARACSTEGAALPM
jgi:hypothetical protein